MTGFSFEKIATYNKIIKERRIAGKLNRYWSKLSDAKSFPAEEKINPNEIPDMWDYCFIVKADNSCKKHDFAYKYLGQNIKNAYRGELNRLSIEALVNLDPGHLEKEYEKVLAWKRPVISNSETTIGIDKILKFRQILLPLGDDGININAILGCMSFRIFSK